jgi:voltage-gated potassium channel Kch
VDAFYFSVTTLTTVGLGDLSPTTTLGKLFTVVYIFAGLSLVLGFIETVAKETFRSRMRGQGSGEDREDALAGSLFRSAVGVAGLPVRDFVG